VHYSGILVVTDPHDLTDCAGKIDDLVGVEVRHHYPELGRMILVQESDSLEQQERGLRAIRAVPGVRLAELVYHHVDD
jgi:nitrate reductase NapAB chaperone NapD